MSPSGSSFADHHRYTAAEARDLLARAEADELVLLTTEKDHVRLAGDPQLAALAARAGALPVRLVIEEDEAFRQMVLNAAQRGAPRPLIAAYFLSRVSRGVPLQYGLGRRIGSCRSTLQ